MSVPLKKSKGKLQLYEKKMQEENEEPEMIELNELLEPLKFIGIFFVLQILVFLLFILFIIKHFFIGSLYIILKVKKMRKKKKNEINKSKFEILVYGSTYFHTTKKNFYLNNKNITNYSNFHKFYVFVDNAKQRYLKSKKKKDPLRRSFSNNNFARIKRMERSSHDLLGVKEWNLFFEINKVMINFTKKKVDSDTFEITVFLLNTINANLRFR